MAPALAPSSQKHPTTATAPSPADYYSGEYEIGIPYWIDSFSVFSSLKSSVNCLNTKDKIFAPMDDDRPCFLFKQI